MQAKNKTEAAREGRRNHTINLCSKPKEALSEPTKGRGTADEIFKLVLNHYTYSNL